MNSKNTTKANKANRQPVFCGVKCQLFDQFNLVWIFSLMAAMGIKQGYIRVSQRSEMAR